MRAQSGFSGMVKLVCEPGKVLLLLTARAVASGPSDPPPDVMSLCTEFDDRIIVPTSISESRVESTSSCLGRTPGRIRRSVVGRAI
jgi:hypothetical protein